MDYQHLYTYLDSRPVDELTDCVSNIVNITRKRSSPVDDKPETEETIILRADDVLLELTRLRTVQRVWIQQAVWNKFGPKTGALPSDHEMSRLLLEPKVTSFLAKISHKIDNEVTRSKVDDRINVDSAPTASFQYEETPVWGSSSSSSASVTSSITGTLSPKSEIGSKRKREEVVTSKRLKWTKEMDFGLEKAVLASEDPVDWSEIAEQVGFGLKEFQCRNRWKYSLDPLKQGGKRGQEWSAEEVAKLHELVQKHSTLPPHWRKGQQSLSENRIDWTAIGAALGRLPKACHGKWNTLRMRTMKGGVFSPAEDALIRQRVTEWGDKGMGLWASLEKEMNRASATIASRWNALLLQQDK